MSGPIRQIIGPTKTRLKGYIENLPDLVPVVDPNLSKPDNVSQLVEIKYKIQHEIACIRNAINLIERNNGDWSRLIASLPQSEAEMESNIYKQTTEMPDNFIEIWSMGLEVMDVLESKLRETEDTIALLQMKTVSPSSESQATSPGDQTGAEAFEANEKTHMAQCTHRGMRGVAMHLPKLKLPIYYGDPLKWTEYWDAFQASVHDQTIPPVQKFNYLLSTLKSRAYTAIEGFAVTNANYEDAINILKRRFGDVDIIKLALYTQIRDLKQATEKTADLRYTLEGIDRVCRQLKSLGEDLNNPILVLSIQEKLPTSILLELEKAKPQGDPWHINQLRTELENVVHMREVAERIHQHSQNNASRLQKQPHRTTTNNTSQPPRASVETFAALTDGNRENKGNYRMTPRIAPLHPCAFCQGSHYNDHCTTVHSRAARQQKVQELRLCFRCLRPGHQSTECSFTKPCFYCKENHNTALCSRKKVESNSFAPAPLTSQVGQQKIIQKEEHSPVKKQAEKPTTRSHAVLEIEDDKIGLEEEEQKDIEGSIVMKASLAFQEKSPVAQIRSEIMLLTAKVRVYNPEITTEQENTATVHVFFDSGSQRSFITQALVNKLGLQTKNEETLTLYTFASHEPQHMKSSVVQIGITLRDGTAKIIQASALPILTNKFKKKALKPDDLQFFKQVHQGDLADDLPSNPEVFVPDILIGSDYFWDFLEPKETVKCPSGLYLIPSKVGLLIGGKQDTTEDTSGSRMYTVLNSQDELWYFTENNTKKCMPAMNPENFWGLESIGIIDSPETKDDDIALQAFNEEIKFENGRYQVKWPWRSASPELPDNFGLCYGRLKSLMNRLSTDIDLLTKYDEIMQDQLKKQIVEKVEAETSCGPIQHYLPHHPVVTPSKSTTKVRIVYDASAKVKRGANSLNDCLYRGPVMLPDLCGLLLRFRKAPIALTADIEKAFLQVGLQVADRDVTRFLWLKDVTKPFSNENLQIYRFCRVTFGVISSPFLLSATLQYHLQKIDGKNALNLAENTYVDNVLTGTESVEDAYQLYEETKMLFSQASMNLREWTSNSEKFREYVREEDKLKETKMKVLGILWHTMDDVLQISITAGPPKGATVTKREVLQTIASTFDPLGIIAPVLLKGKIFFQGLWREKYDWDDPLPEDLSSKWNEILKDWAQNSDFYIPRHIAPDWQGARYQLLTFVDASKDAYAAVVYIRVESEKSTLTQLLFSKNRLTPKKGISLPRLELLAALIGVRITKFVAQQLKLPIEKKTIWSDSQCVLHWIQSPKPLSTFVANRIKEIRAEEDIYFRYISTHENPADISSRGAKAVGFEEVMLWWYGPGWLTDPVTKWPQWNVPEVLPGILKEINNEVKNSFHEAALVALDVSKEFTPLINATRVSTWPKLLRVTVYCLRFLKRKIFNKLSDETKEKYDMQFRYLNQMNEHGAITSDDIKVATTFTLRQAQLQCFPDVIEALKTNRKHQLKDQLGVGMDEERILRCYGRLCNADVCENTKRPILLSCKSHITQLIILNQHISALHSGVQHTLSQLRQEFWIPTGRIAVKKVIRGCFICCKYAAGPYSLPKMPSFPEERVMQAKPFQNTGLDYLGPLWIKSSGDKIKVWICLFTCLVTRAVHLEPIMDLSAQTFLNCIRRFIARRGRPDRIISDNAPQFKLTQKTLDLAWLSIWNDENNVNYFTQNKIDWRFITEYAPWQGGFYERLVGLVKQVLRKTVGRQCLHFEQFFTLLPEVEAVLNSRPLTFIYEDFESKQVLRPVDFLLPQSQIGIPPLEENHENEEYLPPSIDSKQKLLQVWKKSLKNLDKFWDLWYSEYLLSLRERMQNMHKGPRIQAEILPEIDEIVLIKEEDSPRGIWKLGKIVEVKKGRDREIRTAKVLLPNKTILNRPINLLYPLELSEKKNNETVAANVTDRDETQPDDDATKTRENTHVVGRRKPTNIFYTLTMLSLIICLFLTGTQGNTCPQNVHLTRIQSQYCLKEGTVVMRTDDGHLCWMTEKCPVGHLQENGTCGSLCPCPEWAEECSYYSGSSPEKKGDQTTILELAKPSVCAFKPDPNCNEHPTHAQLSQIELYDGTKHYVKNLALRRSQATTEEFECIGEGPQVGTPEFCLNHDCDTRGTKFCYYRENENVFFVNDDGELPIKAWGVVPVTIYGPKEIPPQNPNCMGCSLKCIKGGVDIFLDENMGLIEICSKPYCYRVSHPKRIETIQFPRDVIINSHDVTVRVWSNGYMIKDLGRQCTASPYCEMLQCYFCWGLIANPQCAPQWMMVVIIMMLYFGSVTLYVLVKLLKYGFQFCYYGTYFSWQCLRLCKVMCRRACSKTYERMYLPVYTLFQQEIDKEQVEDRSLETFQLMAEENSYPKKFAYIPQSIYKNPATGMTIFTVVLLLLSIMYPIGMTEACAEVTTLTAQQSVCTVQVGGTMECILTEATRLALVPSGQDSCLLIKDPNGQPIGTLSVEVERIALECKVKNEYFTRSFTMKVKSVKRCPSAGSCSGEKCGAINKDSKIKELKEANNYPGFSYCAASCGCAGCDCFLCTSGCLFYRVYAIPTSDITYELFSCPVWQYKVKTTIRLNLQSENIQQEFILMPGVAETWKNMKLTLTSISSPPVPILGSQFLTDGTKTVMTRASATGQPVSGTVGQIQCSNKDKADKFDCYLSNMVCDCQTQETSAACTCPEMKLEDLFSKPEYVLPMSLEGLSLTGIGSKIEAEYNHIASLELQISMEGFRLSTKIEKNKCIIEPLEIGGCYSCFTGAKFRFECKTDFGEALAHVTCGMGHFSTVCTPAGIKATTTMNFAQAAVKETCIVVCPAGSTTFEIKTTLVFIEKELLGNITSIISAINDKGEIDLGFLSAWLSGNWFAGLIVVVIVIGSIILSVILLPIIVHFVINCSTLTSTLMKRRILGGEKSYERNVIVYLAQLLSSSLVLPFSY